MKIISKIFSLFFEPSDTTLGKTAEFREREARFYQRQLEPKPWMSKNGEPQQSSTHTINIRLEKPPLRERPRYVKQSPADFKSENITAANSENLPAIPQGSHRKSFFGKSFQDKNEFESSVQLTHQLRVPLLGST